MDNRIHKLIESRSSDNHKLLECLKQYLEIYPEIRFGQALINLKIIKLDENNHVIDPFYEEPSEMLKRIDVNKLTVDNFYSA